MPQPLDINTELTRSVTVQRIQELADRASLAAQHRHAKDAQLDQLDAETRIQHTKESEEQPGIGDHEANDADHGSGSQTSEDKSERKHDGGAGDIEVIPEADDRHQLDLRA